MATKYWIASTASSFQGGTGVWSDAASPSNGDICIFGAYGSGNCNTGLSTSLTTVTIIVEPGYTGEIGTVSGGVATYLVLDGGTLRMPANPNKSGASGSQRVLINFGASTGNVIMETSNDTGAEPSIPSVCVLGTDLNIDISGGNLGIAVRPGEVSTITTFAAVAGAKLPYVVLGRGVTGTNCDAVNGGTVYDMRTNLMKSIRNFGQGVWDYTGTGATTTVYGDGGTIYYSGTGTITTANGNGAKLDFSRGLGCTVTNSTFNAGTLNVDNGAPGSIIFTNATSFPNGIDAVSVITPGGVKAKIEAA